jgi:glutaredoxin 3
MSGKIEIYTRSRCAYCQRAKDLLQIKGVSYTEHNLDERPSMTWRGTPTTDKLPKIYIDGTLIDGCSELFELDERGELDRILHNRTISSGSPQ